METSKELLTLKQMVKKLYDLDKEVTNTQLLILLEIANDEGMTGYQIADKVNRQQGIVSRVIQKWADLGLVNKVPKDRGNSIELTKQGNIFLQSLIDMMKGVNHG